MAFNFKHLIISVLFIIFIPAPAQAAWGPWDNNHSGPVVKKEIETSVPRIFTLSAVRFYQSYISPLLRKEKCNFTPSCSHYSVQAIEEYGALRGLVMTFDRLSRCHPWAWDENYGVKDKRLYDPPEENNYW